MSDYPVRAVLEAYDKNFTSGMKKAASVIDSTESSANSLSSRIKTGLGFGALMAIGTKAVNTISNAITSNLGSAIKRFDTLNNFPKIMKNLGYSATDAQRAIDKMSNGIDGLPTALDDIASATTKIAPLTKNLDEATEVTLAFNNALLAGGKDAATQANALEQFSQMLAAGKVDAQAWMSVNNAMPGQMNQIAESILGVGKKSDDLKNAMKSGKVSFEDFNNALKKLNKEGLESGGKKFASFEQQAKDATQGIGTSMANLRTGIVRGLTGMIEKADGILYISSNITKLSSGIKGLMGRISKSKTFSNILTGASKTVKAFIPAAKMVGKVVEKAAVAFGKGAKYIGDHSKTVAKLAKVLVGLWAAYQGASIISGVGKSILGVTGTIGKFAGKIQAAGGLASAFAGSTLGIGAAAVGAMASVGLLAYSVYTLAKRYKEAEREANKNIQARKDAVEAVDAETGRVDQLYRRLEELDGIENKSTDQKNEMKWIIDQLNGSVDGLNAKYDEEKGKVEGGTEAIKERIDAYKEEARAAVLKDSLKAAYKDQQENEKKLAEAYEKREKAQEKADKSQQNGLKNQGAVNKAKRDLAKYNNQVEDLTKAGQKYEEEINGLETRLGNLGNMNAFDDLVAKARKAGIDVTDGFVASVRQGQAKVPGSIFEMVQAMNPPLDEAVKKANKTGIKIPDELKRGIESGQTSPTEAVKQINALIDADEKKQPGISRKNGEATVHSHADGINSKQTANQTAAASLVDKAIGALQAGASKGNAPGGGLGDSYVSGVNSKSSDANTAGAGLASSANTGASGSWGFGSSRGGEFGSGYVSGVSGCLTLVQNVAARIAAIASAAAAAAQKSGSPSRVAMKRGKEFGTGYAIGIEKEAKNVAKAARDMVYIPDVMSPQLDYALAGGGNLKASVQYSVSNLATDIKGEIMSALMQRPLVVQPSIEIDGRQVAKSTAPYMEEDIAQLQARANRKKGIL